MSVRQLLETLNALDVWLPSPPLRSAFDISDIALETASENAIANNANVKFIKTDILNFDPSIYNNQFDIIVSNPTYIGDSEITDMERFPVEGPMKTLTPQTKELSIFFNSSIFSLLAPI